MKLTEFMAKSKFESKKQEERLPYFVIIITKKLVNLVLIYNQLELYLLMLD